MLNIVVVAVIGVCLVEAQHHQQQNHQFQPQYQQHQQQQPYSGNSGYSGYSSGSGQSSLYTTTTPRPYFPPAQVHYVNIGQDLAGDYKFGYDTGKGPLGQSFREEVRLPDGTVMGAYGYLDEQGKQRIVKYTAGKEGFKVDSDTPAPSNGEAPQKQASSRPASPPTPQVSHSLPQSPPQYLPQQQLPAPRPAPQPQPQYQYQPPPQPPTPPRYQQIALPKYASEVSQHQPQQQYQPPPQQYQPPPQQYQPPPQATYQPPPSYQTATQYQAPAVQFQKSAPAAYREPRSRQPAQQLSGQDLLSAFPQLPGVQLMVINPKPRPTGQYSPQAYSPGYLPSSSQPSSNTLLQSQSRNVPKEEEYTGPVVINAALLNYDIGTSNRRN